MTTLVSYLFILENFEATGHASQTALRLQGQRDLEEARACEWPQGIPDMTPAQT